MRNLRTATIFAAGLLASSLAMAAQTYQLDRAHSRVNFAVKHLGVSTVRGEFQDFSVTLAVDEQDLAGSSVEVRIKAQSIDTGVADRDNHLRSGDFLDAATHPEIVFKSKHIEKDGEDYLAVGDLTIRGVTKEVRLPFTLGGPINMGDHLRVGAEGTLTINRHDYGVSWSRVLDTGGLVVANDVKIEFAVEATRPAS